MYSVRALLENHTSTFIYVCACDLQDSIASLESQLQDLVEDEKTLDSKIKKKQAELSRNQKRLESLQTVRPAFMDEYEKLERELSEEYEGYISRYRNLHFLEHELDEHTKVNSRRCLHFVVCTHIMRTRDIAATKGQGGSSEQAAAQTAKEVKR
jgi:clusterin-associated protein 1